MAKSDRKPIRLTGLEWQVEAINGEIVAENAFPRIEFSSGGKVVGTTGLNRFFGQYTYSNGTPTLQEFGTTRMAGLPPAMDQDGEFLAPFSGELEVHIHEEKVLLQRSGVSLAMIPLNNPNS